MKTLIKKLAYKGVLCYDVREQVSNTHKDDGDSQGIRIKFFVVLLGINDIVLGTTEEYCILGEEWKCKELIMQNR